MRFGPTRNLNFFYVKKFSLNWSKLLKYAYNGSYLQKYTSKWTGITFYVISIEIWIRIKSNIWQLTTLQKLIIKPVLKFTIRIKPVKKKWQTGLNKPVAQPCLKNKNESFWTSTFIFSSFFWHKNFFCVKTFHIFEKTFHPITGIPRIFDRVLNLKKNIGGSHCF